MNIYEFASLVKQMRKEQQDFFRTRNKKHLDSAKLLENKVDKAISEVLTTPETQKSLF